MKPVLRLTSVFVVRFAHLNACGTSQTRQTLGGITQEEYDE